MPGRVYWELPIEPDEKLTANLSVRNIAVVRVSEEAPYGAVSDASILVRGYISELENDPSLAIKLDGSAEFKRPLELNSEHLDGLFFLRILPYCNQKNGVMFPVGLVLRENPTRNDPEHDFPQRTYRRVGVYRTIEQAWRYHEIEDITII